MALGDVGELVAEHAGHLGLAFEVHEQAREDVDVAAGHREGVNGVVQDDACLEGEGLGRDGLGDARHEPLHVVAYFGILHHGQGGAHEHVELAAHLLLVLERHAPEVEGLGAGREDEGPGHDRAKRGRQQAGKAGKARGAGAAGAAGAERRVAGQGRSLLAGLAPAGCTGVAGRAEGAGAGAWGRPAAP